MKEVNKEQYDEFLKKRFDYQLTHYIKRSRYCTDNDEPDGNVVCCVFDDFLKNNKRRYFIKDS